MAKKNSKRREWTKTDIREPKTLARGKTPAAKIARALKRTEGATRQKAFSLGVSHAARACRCVSPVLAWNKGLEVGKRDGFTPHQVKRIRGLLADRGVPGLRDLALFSTAIDTMLHGQDLLPLVVG